MRNCGKLQDCDCNPMNLDQQSIYIHQVLFLPSSSWRWAYDRDLADNDTLATIARSVGIDPEPLLVISGSKVVLDIYEANTKEAIEISVFGSPTYLR